MNTIPKITNQREEYAALDRLDELWGSPRNSPEGREARALAQVIQDYQIEQFWSKLPEGDAAVTLEVRLDTGFNTLDELLPLFGGMDEFIAFMTREKPLSEELIDKLDAELGIKREWLDMPFNEPGGWELMEECTDGKDWRAEMIAHRDTNAAKQQRAPELAAAAT